MVFVLNKCLSTSASKRVEANYGFCKKDKTRFIFNPLNKVLLIDKTLTDIRSIFKLNFSNQRFIFVFRYGQ